MKRAIEIHLIQVSKLAILLFCVGVGTSCASKKEFTTSILPPDELQEYVNYFNGLEEEKVVNHVSDEEIYKWLKRNVPLLDVPDPVIEQIYYFRCWTFRQHLKKMSEGFVFTEFITAESHGRNYDTISS